MMDIDKLFTLDQLIFKDRECRVCGKLKSLMDDFYVTRKDRGTIASAYSYECKECTIKRVKKSRQRNNLDIFEYPDW